MSTDKETIKKSVKKEKTKKAKLEKPKKTAGGEKLKKEKKTKIEKTSKKEKEIKTEDIKEKPKRYFEAVGRRKTAVARVRLFTQGEKVILINEKLYKDYFPISENQKVVIAPLEKMKVVDRFRVLVKVRGGGINAQAEAVRHGIARALLKFNPDFRKKLKRAGFLTRDPRKRERKKFGLKRARRAPQWRKR